MNILYIHQYFNTPDEPGGIRSYCISQELIRRGNKVIMITGTSPAHPETNVEMIDGIEVHYIKNSYSNYMGAGSRMMSFIKFMLKAIKEGSKQKDIDLVFATSTPLTVGAVAIALKTVKKWKYVFEVRDLWPEALIQGGLTNPIAVWMLRRLEKMSYKYAEHVIALSPGMEDGVQKVGIPKEKCSMIPNMAKPNMFYPHDPSSEIIKKFNIDLTKFNVIHFGSMGQLNGLEYIIDAANIAKNKNYKDLNFIFIGEGSTEPALKRMAKDCELGNVQFLGNHPMTLVAEIVNCCDASITSFKNKPILATNSPNKLFDSLSAGKPIIVNSRGWTKDLVEKDDCGFFVDPEKPEDLVNKLMQYKDDKQTLERWSNNSRRLSVEVFDKDILSAKVADIIENVAR